MIPSCHPMPNDRKSYIKELGNNLIKEYGKRKFYKPSMIKKSHRKNPKNDLDFSCWGMSIFSSHKDFDQYHEIIGEECDYVDMKTQMLAGLSYSQPDSMANIPYTDLDTSWMDIGETLGDLMEGLGDFFGSLFDGV